MNLELTDKIAIVTGSSRGLGLASARALLLEGCRVCICARGQKRLNEAADELRNQVGAHERVITVNTDLSQREGVESVIQETVDHFGGLDILINSVGKALAQQLASKNIRVNSVAPGSILFPGGSWHRRQQSDPEGMATFVSQNLPFGRFGEADEVGTVVAFLASPRASWVSGASIAIDGCQSRSLF